MDDVNVPETTRGAVASMDVRTLTRRRDFLAARDGARAHTTAFVLQLRHRGDEADTFRVGYTVTKKVGNAVLRNRIKRRLREAVRHADIGTAVAGCDAVLIARESAATHPFDHLTTDLAAALARAAGDRRLRQARNSGHRVDGPATTEALQNAPSRGTSPADIGASKRSLPAQ